MFSKAIVRKPTPEMIHGLTSANLGQPDFDRAIEQHDLYVEALISLDLEIMTLGPDSRYPDSTFVEDTAIICEHFGLITRPGAVTRRGEVLEIEYMLHRLYKDLEYIYSPGTLDGGDVMLAGDHFFIGLSDRTNKNGAEQFIQIAEKYGMSGTKVPLENLLHLKSGVSYLENNYMIMVANLKKSNFFERFNQIKIPDEEAYAANCLWINGTVLVAEGFPETKALIESVGIKTIALDMSEFRKLDGGLSCLSLRV